MTAFEDASGSSEARFEEMLEAVRGADRRALDRIFEVAYGELRALARSVRRSFPEDSLEISGLVSETYLKLLRARRISIADRVHFFSLVARAMRQILICRAQQKGRLKRGGGASRQALDESEVAAGPTLPLDELLTLQTGLERLAERDPRLAQLVELRFVEGLNESEIAAIFGLSARTVRREWSRARTFLEAELQRAPAARGS
ncbi:MAG: sigma-70 family RNA polymerase sigma factor [Thermoanaerobaculia bacterium]|nr:MAG: sigma-70 family RNA polymerase sigma factor [Thermoanaerobaculia bacterium]